MTSTAAAELNILISYFSRTGNTERIAKVIGLEIERRGHSVVYDKIRPLVTHSVIREAVPVLPGTPAFCKIFIGLFSQTRRQHYVQTMKQYERGIQPMKYPDVKKFDRICVGGPKWGLMSFHVARYLKTMNGFEAKKVGIFSTFAGPPLPVFEVEWVDKLMTRSVREVGAAVVSRLFLSSGYHEAGLMPLFRLVCRVKFKKPIGDFMLGSDYASKSIQYFCDALLANGN